MLAQQKLKLGVIYLLQVKQTDGAHGSYGPCCVSVTAMKSARLAQLLALALVLQASTYVCISLGQTAEKMLGFYGKSFP